jgi:hypothetical protein
MELRIDSVKLVHWYDETYHINTNVAKSKEVLQKVNVLLRRNKSFVKNQRFSREEIKACV